jgi:ribokinase
VTTGRVVVVGDLITDVVAVLDAVPAPGSDTPARIRTTGGGQAANTAAWLAKQGVPVTLVAAAGDDDAGRARVAELAAAGVTCAVRHHPGVPTGTVVVLTHDGERTMITDRGANLRLHPSDVDSAFTPDTVHLHLSGYPLLDEGSRAAGLHALQEARSRGITSSVDAASVHPLRQVGVPAFLSWVRGVDLLLANRDEAALLAGPAPYAVVVKLGADGALWTAPDREPVTVPADPVDVVDTTGAGDAFAAGLLAAWLAGADPASALRAGARLGAAAVRTLGARS